MFAREAQDLNSVPRTPVKSSSKTGDQTKQKGKKSHDLLTSRVYFIMNKCKYVNRHKCGYGVILKRRPGEDGIRC